MKISVIVSTYNQPRWLEKVLYGYHKQTHRDFEMVIADDGSGEETREVISNFVKNHSRKLVHVWQEDHGFQKPGILNKAILASTGEYLIFTDGDCIPREDFVATHVRYAKPRTFLSGGYCKLPMNLSTAITPDDIESGKAFDVAWLKKHGLKDFSTMLKLTRSSSLAIAADFLTTRKATWNGCNASTWKEEIIAVNGHNEDMHYGGEDREMGLRMSNSGCSSKQIRCQAVLLHLDHSRSYVNEEALAKNLSIRKATKASRSTWCVNGIHKQPQP